MKKVCTSSTSKIHLKSGETSNQNPSVCEEMLETPYQTDIPSPPVQTPTTPSGVTPLSTKRCSSTNCAYKRLLEHQKRANRRLKSRVRELKLTVKSQQKVANVLQNMFCILSLKCKFS